MVVEASLLLTLCLRRVLLQLMMVVGWKLSFP